MLQLEISFSVMSFCVQQSIRQDFLGDEKMYQQFEERLLVAMIKNGSLEDWVLTKAWFLLFFCICHFLKFLCICCIIDL